MKKEEPHSKERKTASPGFWATLSIILFLLSGMILCPGGQLIGLWLTLIAILMLIHVGRKGWRIFGVVLLILCLVTMISAWRMAKQFETKIQRMRAKIEWLQRHQPSQMPGKSKQQTNLATNAVNSTEKNTNRGPLNKAKPK